MVGFIGLILGGSHVEYISKCFWTLHSVSTMYLLKLGPALNSFFFFMIFPGTLLEGQVLFTASQAF